MSRRIAVVTGASAGIGRATAVALATEGFDVALLARGQAGLEGAAKEVEAAGGRALCVLTDVADHAQVEAAAQRVEDELGAIDVWVNNAMTTVFAAFEDVEPAEFERATAVTYLGQVYGTMAALKRMRPRDRGRIVNVGSALAFVGIPLQSAYCGAKFACLGFTESVRAELLEAGSNVTVSLVHLPAVNTNQFEWCRNKMPERAMPVPPIYEPEVPAAAIVAAALDGRRSRTVGTWNTMLIGAAKVAPAIVAQFAARTGADSQQTDEPARDRPDNLFEPLDADEDWGVRGRFGEQSGGVFELSFLNSLPSTLKTLGESVVAAGREHLVQLTKRAT